MCMEYGHDHAKLASKTGQKQISRAGKGKHENVHSWILYALFATSISTLLNILSTLEWTGILFFNV